MLGPCLLVSHCTLPPGCDTVPRPCFCLQLGKEVDRSAWWDHVRVSGVPHRRGEPAGHCALGLEGGNGLRNTPTGHFLSGRTLLPTPDSGRPHLLALMPGWLKGAGGQVWFTFLLLGICSPLFPVLQAGLRARPRPGEGWREWAMGPMGLYH